jgi:hypothetical protein
MQQKLLRLLPIVVLIAVLGVGYYYTKARESFDNPSVDKTFFNNVNNLFNPVMPHQITTEDMKKATVVHRATNQPYIGNAYEKKMGQGNVKVGTIYDPSDALNKAQTICEVVDGRNCNAFDTPDFAKYCGISMDAEGKTSKGIKKEGGLYIAPEYKETIPDNGIFYPTFGTSEYFAVNKATCVYMRNDLECKAKETVGTNNCTMCLSSGSYQAVESVDDMLLPDFVFFTNAKDLVVQVASTPYTLLSSNTTNKPISTKVTLLPDVTSSMNDTLKTVKISNLNVIEGNSIIITASHTDPDVVVLLGGYLQGATRTGEAQIPPTPLQMDINDIMNTDNGGTPLVGGTASGYLLIHQNYNKDNTNIKLNGMMPFTFINTTSPDTDNCKNAPFITTSEGMDYISQNEPCYGPKAKDKNGAYSQPCLQNMFLGAGGTVEGLGYPNTAERAAALNSAGGGTLIGIGNYLYSQSVLASTGLVNGKVADPISLWNNASKFMTGKAITNPCQTSDRRVAVSDECNQYLYEQSGCLDKGTYNPKKSGYTKPAAISTTKKPEDISEFYAITKQKADNSALSNRDRAAAYEACYGVTLLQQ